MDSITATFVDGSTVEFSPDLIGEGGMKQVYFTVDKSAVVCFYKARDNFGDNRRIDRLKAIVGKYNPTSDASTGDYFKKLFCWPCGIVVKPQLGVLAPTYPKNYFFASGPLAGKEKESTWFIKPKLRRMLPKEELGTWINYLKICILLARAVRRMHQAGLAHSDLSNKNVLVDPVAGECVIIDIDSLVVPGLFPPDVVGTRGYIAPEVVATLHLPLDDPQRHHPSASTDQHALAVLIYQYLLGRHPLEGPKTYPASSAEEQERLEMGKNALFVEHPSDRSNRPQDLQLPYTCLGPHLSKLVLRSFVDGLHAPNERPAAIEWERSLIKTWDLLLPCQNSNCPSHWFVLADKDKVVCPFCGTIYRGTIPILRLRSQRRPGQWMVDGEVMVYHHLSLFPWHVFANIFPGEEADRTPQAYCIFHQDRWFLVNQALSSLTSLKGDSIPLGKAARLEEGVYFRLDREPYGRIAEVQMIHAG